MNKAELIEALADKTGLQKQEAKKVLDAYIEIVTERMSENEEIVLVGFGTLIPRPQTQRLARNPKTGTPVMIPARTTVKFKPGKFLLEAMNAMISPIRSTLRRKRRLSFCISTSLSSATNLFNMELVSPRLTILMSLF